VDFGVYGVCSLTEGSIYERRDNTLRMKGTGQQLLYPLPVNLLPRDMEAKRKKNLGHV
jgi:hypothetical protein